MNVGASSAEDFGDYYSWGNVDGHAANSGYNFSSEVYEQTPGGQLASDIDAAHDAAAVAWGDGWRMPSFLELQELRDNCTFAIDTIGDVAVIRAVSNINGQSVVFPCAGYWRELVVLGVGSAAYFWGTRMGPDGDAYRIALFGSTANVGRVATRYYGFSIRAVRDP